MTWQLHDAKALFSQVVNRALREEPQFVTRYGEDVVVVLSTDEYRRLVGSKPNLLDLLMDSPLAGSGLEIGRDRNDFGQASVLRA